MIKTRPLSACIGGETYGKAILPELDFFESAEDLQILPLI